MTSTHDKKHPIIAELEEILADPQEYEVDVASVKNAITFANWYIVVPILPPPRIEIHPDREVAFTWRSDNGMMNVAFDKKGIVTFAAALRGGHEEKKYRNVPLIG